MKILLIGVDRFLCNIVKLLPAPVEAVICNRKQTKDVFRLENPDKIVIFGPWGEIAGAGPDEKSVESMKFHQKVKTLVGEKVEVLRCGYEDKGNEADFIQIPFSSFELLKKFGYYGRRK